MLMLMVVMVVVVVVMMIVRILRVVMVVMMMIMMIVVMMLMVVMVVVVMIVMMMMVMVVKVVMMVMVVMVMMVIMILSRQDGIKSETDCDEQLTLKEKLELGEYSKSSAVVEQRFRCDPYIVLVKSGPAETEMPTAICIVYVKRLFSLKNNIHLSIYTFRYKAIVNPMDIQAPNAVLWTCIKAIIIWVISILLAVPEAVFSEVAHINDADNVSFTECIRYPSKDDLHPRIHSVMILLVYLLIPLTIISIYYFHIARTLIKSAHNLPGEYSEQTKKQMETRKRLAKIVLVFVGLFAVCWLPTHVLYLYRSFNYNTIDPSLGHMVVTLVARVLSFSNSCVNPFALYFLSESFRQHFNGQLCCRIVPRQQRSASYLNSTLAIGMSSMENNTRNTVAVTTLLNGHSPKQDIPL
ncbi:hypothetical protein JD844_024582 [Phrynosoma platyrhinos]|uniref:G-protein coupled receptors family 1 profile domain-containing protein n=1 Tax=Phrynosoma platyrhinos TaxID=52577 RepID=A0ABQ7SY69_PHRPL|nr:hypothetical protein JD844_024582 [Phrynosoma platyrhinos]